MWWVSVLRPAASTRSTRFFDHLPTDTGMAFVVVQHLSPDFKSLMDELLARHTQLPIHLVENGMPVEADHIYLIPSQEGDDHLRRAPAPERARPAAGADAAHRRLLPLARAGLRAARGRHRALGRRQRRLARGARRPRGRRPRPRPGGGDARSSTGCRGPRATPASPMRLLPPEEMPQVLVEHAARAAGRGDAAGGRAHRAPRASRPSTGCWRTSSASTSPTTSRAR